MSVKSLLTSKNKETNGFKYRANEKKTPSKRKDVKNKLLYNFLHELSQSPTCAISSNTAIVSHRTPWSLYNNMYRL